MPCETPNVICNNWYLTSPDMQRYLLLQVLRAITGTVETNAALAAGYLCQGSPAKIRAVSAQQIVDDLPDVDAAQPVCMDPLVMEGAIANLICQAIEAL